MNEQVQPTLWDVAASQNAQPIQQVVTETTQPAVQQEQPIQQQVQQPVQEQPAPQQEQPTLNDVARENEMKQNEQEARDAFQKIIDEANKWVVSPEPSHQAVDTNNEQSDKESDLLKWQIDEIKSTKDATNVAKKVYLAYEKERHQHQLDNETNAQTINDLKELIKQLNAKTNSMEVDPRVVKLDDENYALYRIRSNYKNNTSKENKENLTKFYLTEIGVMHPDINVNKLISFMNEQSKGSNTIGAWNWTPAPVAEPVKVEVPRPRWIPASQRGIL